MSNLEQVSGRCRIEDCPAYDDTVREGKLIHNGSGHPARHLHLKSQAGARWRMGCRRRYTSVAKTYTPIKRTGSARMSIRSRVALILVVVVAVYAVLQFLIQQFVLLPYFEDLEREEAKEDLVRATGSLRYEIETLDLLLFDWSSWDDTYAFIRGGSRAYEKANLTDVSFTQNRLSLIYFIDTTGKVVWGKVFDLEKEKPMEMEEFPARQWPATHFLLQHSSPKSSLTGVMLTRHGPMLIASRPIVTTEVEGPIRGTMLMGRFLDKLLVDRISRLAQVKFSVSPLALSDSVTPEEREVLQHLTEGASPYFHPQSDLILQVYGLCPGIDGRPALLMKVDVPRDIMARGRTTLQVVRSMTIIMAGTGLLIVLILLRMSVVQPIASLTKHVTHLGATGKLTLLPPPKRKDEIGILAREFNEMIRRIQSDNDERTRAEDALRESEARIRTIIAAAPDGIITVDEGGVIETFNPAAQRLFEYSDEEVVGKHLRDLMPDLYADKGLQPLVHVEPPVPPSQFAKPRQTVGTEGLGRRKDGTVFPLYWTVSEARVGGRLIFTGIVRDVTELRQLHEEVLHAEHLATIGEMGASIAHEVRNPLAGISGAVQVLRDGLPPGDARHEVVEEILGQVNRVDAIVRRLLMFAKMWLPVRKSTDLRQLAGKITEVAATREPWKDVRFAFVGEPALEALVDPELVEQALWNLLENAADAIQQSKSGRTVCQTPANCEGNGIIQWEFRKTACGVRVTLKDNGCGMTPEAERKLFHPFFTTKTYGTGLGLLICRRIMEAHGGTIEVAGKSEEGTEVSLDFPIEV